MARFVSILAEAAGDGTVDKFTGDGIRMPPVLVYRYGSTAPNFGAVRPDEALFGRRWAQEETRQERCHAAGI